jgi:hypothetical protein
MVTESCVTGCGERPTKHGYCRRCLAERRAELTREIQALKVQLVQRQAALEDLN